jgi:hypothetical protein
MLLDRAKNEEERDRKPREGRERKEDSLERWATRGFPQEILTLFCKSKLA